MKIICVGRNYSEHISELNNAIPDDIVVFLKPESAICQSNEWVYPSFTNEVHYECEIALKVCKTGKNIVMAEAGSYFQEITLGIDFTARDIQQNCKSKGLPWEKAKAFDNAALIGDWIEKSQVDLKNVSFELHKNGNPVQVGESSKMIYDFHTIISKCSEYFTLNKGDIILTGTPAGVGKVNSNDEFRGILENKEVLRFIVR